MEDKLEKICFVSIMFCVGYCLMAHSAELAKEYVDVFGGAVSRLLKKNTAKERIQKRTF